MGLNCTGPLILGFFFNKYTFGPLNSQELCPQVQPTMDRVSWLLSTCGWICRCRVCGYKGPTMGHEHQGFWYLQRVLEPVLHRYHGTTVYNTVLLPIFTMPYITPHDLFYNWKFVLWTPFTCCVHSSPPTSGNYQSLLYIYEFSFFVFLDST